MLSVNETTPSAKPRQWMRAGASVAAFAVVLGLLIWFIALPWLLRNRVEAAMRDAGVRGVSFHVERATPWGSTLTRVVGGEGALGVEHVTLEYSPADLWHGKLNAIHISGGRIELTAREGKIDFSPLAKFIVQSSTTPQETKTAGALPLSRIDLTQCAIVLKTEQQTLDVPVDLTVTSTRTAAVLIDAHLGPSRNLTIESTIDRAAHTASFQGLANAGWTLLTLRTIWPNAQIDVDGTLQLSGAAKWDDNGLSGSTTVQIVPPAATTQPATQESAPAQLHVASGVFVVTANFGSKPLVRLSAKNASFAMKDKAVAAEGVTGEIVFDKLSPLSTPMHQQFAVAKLSAGQMQLADGHADFQMIASDTINVRETRWKWLGGEVLAQGVRVHGSDPVKIDLQLRDVELKDLLALFAQDKASGQGRLSGVLPVTISGSKVDFGEGRVTALTGGAVQIKDAAAVLPTAEAAASVAKSPSSAEQIKHNIIEALGDFVFDRLSAQMTNEDGKLVAYVRMSGHGRSGAKQGLDYELRVNGVDSLLKAYMNIQAAMPPFGSEPQGRRQAAALQQKLSATRKASP